MSYISLLGHPTWASIGGEKDETVLLLHGGLSNSDVLLDTIGKPLGETYRLAAFDRRGHGRTADTSEPFHYAAMADETIAFLEHLGDAAHLVGWSDGGNAGLFVALHRPDLVGRLVMIGSNYHHDGLRALASPDEVFATAASGYAERSPDGADHFGEVLKKTLGMWSSEPELTVDDLRSIGIPALVMVGDDDAIKLSHSCSMYESIPGAEFAVVPGASHALPIEQPDETARIIANFLQSVLPPTTLMPIDRARNRQAVS